MRSFLRGAAWFLLLGRAAFAGELWHYEIREGVFQTPVAPETGRSGDKFWFAAAFHGDPATVELEAVRGARGYQRVSLAFDRSVSPALGSEYLALAREWSGSGVRGELKFTGTLPTEPESEILKPVCALGVKIRFYSTVLPTPYEAANLLALKDCAEVGFAIGHYFKSEEIPDVRRLSGLPLSLLNDYYPTYAHVDNLNRLEGPLGVQVEALPPTAEQVDVLNRIKRLSSLYVNLDTVPCAGDYDGLASLDRGGGARLSIRWGFGSPGESDLAAWERLRPEHLIIPASFLATAGAEDRLRALDSEVILETSAH